MGFFERMRNGLIRFMYGRNGMDQLNRALLWVYLAVWILRMVTLTVLRGPAYHLWSIAWEILTWALIVLLFFRMFSKNLYKRREENQKWVNWWWRTKSAWSGARARHADKDHKYFTCKNCKTICRVPVGKGKIVITGPKCGALIRGRT